MKSEKLLLYYQIAIEQVCTLCVSEKNVRKNHIFVNRHKHIYLRNIKVMSDQSMNIIINKWCDDIRIS